MVVDSLERLKAALADRYTIERQLGAGGMATVYLAADLKHDRKVAIKVLRPELAAVLGAERFVQEIKTTANLQHPHILPLFDSGQALVPPLHGVKRGTGGEVERGTGGGPRVHRLAMMLAVTVFLAALAAWGWLRPIPRPVPRAMSVQLGLPEGYEVRSEPGGILALSPDGSKLAVLGRTPASASNVLLVRPVDATEATEVRGSEGARDPAWSPSGDSLAFVVGSELRIASLLPGGRTSTLSTSPIPAFQYGVSWSDAGEIAYMTADGIGVYHVPDGTEQRFSLSGRIRWPHWIPGERLLTFTEFTDFGSGTGAIGVLDVRTGEPVDSLTVGFNGRVSTSGHLVWADREATIWAAPLDVAALRLDGAPTAMMSGVFVAPGREARFSIARSGDLAYVRSVARTDLRLMLANARTGERQQVPLPRDLWLSSDLDLSPDGSKVAYSAVQSTSHDVWLTDLASGRAERFSTQWGASHHPVWTPDGERLAYYSADAGLLWRPYDRSSGVRALSRQDFVDPTAWSRDGTVLLGGEGDIWTLRVPDSVPTFLAQTDALERTPTLSPDGRWLAYASDQSGTTEIWVHAFEGDGGPWMVSEHGGITPIWSAGGDRLYFRTRTAIMVAEIRAGSTFRWTAPTILLASAYPTLGSSSWERSFDVFPGGDRLVLYESSGSPPWEVTYETGWVQRMLQGGGK